MRRRTAVRLAGFPTEPGFNWRPIWDRRDEVAVCTLFYAEGRMDIFGTGTVQVVMRVLPIVVRMAFRVVAGRFRWALATAVRRELAMALRKIVAQVGPNVSTGPGAADAASWPNLWQYLSQEAYDDGTPRQKTTLVIVANQSGWQGCLSDKDNSRVMWKTSETVEGLLLALEEGAALDDPQAWRAATPEKWKKKK